MSIKQIGLRTGCDRRTVRKYVAADEPPRYEREDRGSVLDPYNLTLTVDRMI
jgi:transposase